MVNVTGAAALPPVCHLIALLTLGRSPRNWSRRKVSRRMTTSEPRGEAVQETTQTPYATDGADVKDALRHHYAIALKRFLKAFAIVTPMAASAFVTKIEYLLPLSIVGMPAVVGTVVVFYARTSLIWRCSRVFRTYPLEFRGTVEKGKLQKYARSRLPLRFGKQADASTMMCAKYVLGGNGWPEGIENGVWFAGDDPFGGAAIVPGTGELLFMQPSEWVLSAKERESAGEVRIKQAKRAGINRAVSYR